jgi:uncharacterized membrane protein YczE
MGDFFEMLMVLAFGFAWPTSIIKSWKARTAKGKSLSFLIIIIVGYICGITSKLITNRINYVLIFYIINLVMVSFDLVLYFRNVRLDRERESAEIPHMV